MNISRRNAVAALTAAGLLWGTTVPLSKLALVWLSPGWLTAVRFGLAAAVLLAVAGRNWPRLRAAFTPKVLFSGAFGYGGSVVVQNAGITRTSVTHAALLIGAVPMLVAVIAAIWHHTVARPVAWAGFVVSLLGVGLIAGAGGGGATTAGDGLVLASLLLSATVTVAQAWLLPGRDPVAVTAVQFLAATVAALVFAAFTSGAPAAPAGAGPVLAVLALAAGGTLLPFTLFAFGQSRVSAEVAGAFLNLEPLVGAMAGVVVFGNPFGPGQAAGGAAIMVGIALSSLPLLTGRRSRRTRALGLETGGAETGAAGAVAAGNLAAEAAATGASMAEEPGAAGLGAPTDVNGYGALPAEGETLSHPWDPGGSLRREMYLCETCRPGPSRRSNGTVRACGKLTRRLLRRRPAPIRLAQFPQLDRRRADLFLCAFTPRNARGKCTRSSSAARPLSR